MRTGQRNIALRPCFAIVIGYINKWTPGELLGERLGTDIPLMTLLEHTSIRALAAWLDNRTPRTTAQEISAPEGGGSASAFDRGMDRAERRMRTRSRQRTGR